jgi:SGNH hydrolase-like domain, acetyltransferase AlgX
MRKLEWTFVVSLLLVCAGFPLVQAGYEMAVKHEMPHFFKLFTQFPSKENLHRWDDNAKDHNIFAEFLRPIALQWRYDVLGEMSPKAVPGKEGWLFYNQDVDYLLQPTYKDDRFYKNTFDTLIGGKHVNLRNPLVAMRDFRDQLKAKNIDLLLVPIPGKPSIYPEKLAGTVSGNPQSPTLELLNDLRQDGFQVVDLFHPLLEAKSKGTDLLYLKRDTHWSPQGMQVAARVIAARIQEMLPPPSAGADSAASDSLADSLPASPRFALKSVAVDRWGDVAEMTKVPNRKKIWELEKVEAQQVVDSAGRGYKDDPESEILWLGDSYSRIYQTDEPRSAGVIAHVAQQLQRPLTSIVNDGGASTVVRQQLARRGALLKNKKLVVWTFVERDLRFGSKGWQIESLP